MARLGRRCGLRCRYREGLNHVQGQFKIKFVLFKLPSSPPRAPLVFSYLMHRRTLLIYQRRTTTQSFKSAGHTIRTGNTAKVWCNENCGTDSAYKSDERCEVEVVEKPKQSEKDTLKMQLLCSITREIRHAIVNAERNAQRS